MVAYLTPTNCETCTATYLRCTWAELLGLTGIYGIHTLGALEAIGVLRKPLRPQLKNGIVNFFAETDKLKVFDVQINLLAKTIENVEFVKWKDAEDGLALKRLIQQVKYATKLEFKSIVLWAYKTQEGDKQEYFGYEIWGKYGFVMDEQSHENYLSLVKEHYHGDRVINNIYDLLLFDEGKSIWKQYGFEWLGEFDLTPNSYSLNTFKTVLEKKNLLSQLTEFRS